jgi:uncharacterized phage protein (TIGR01671 family)
MREIKFRFWNKIAHRFQPPSKYAVDGEGKLVAYDYEMRAYDDPVDFSNTCIVAQQYTGLKDKNGVDIYEGDVIEVENHISIEKVIFMNGLFGIHLNYKNSVDARRKDSDQADLYPLVEFDYIKVIGNIFENPELIKL